MKSFSGEFRYKVDGKGRVSLPADFRRIFNRVGSAEVKFLTVGRPTDGLQAFTETGLDALIARIERSDRPVREKERLLSDVIGRAQSSPIDDAGRVVLPPAVRSRLGIEGGIVFVGTGSKFRLFHPKDRPETADEDLDALLDDLDTGGLEA